MELYTYIGNIWRLGHHTHATGRDALDIAFYKTQDNINIMDHQVKDHTHFSSPGIKLGKPVHFDEHRVQLHVFNSEESGIEALYMTYLAYDTGFFHQLYQQPGFIHGIGQWLFHENM